MLLRATVMAGAAALLSTAPMQCGHTPDAELREDETPGDALWGLAQKFKAAHDDAGEKLVGGKADYVVKALEELREGDHINATKVGRSIVYWQRIPD